MDIFDSWLVNNYIADGGLSNENCFENTLPAYQKALDKNYPILIDVQSLCDGTIICFKDSKLQKHTNKNGYVTNLTNVDIENLKLKDGNNVPTLDEALELINGKVPVVINIVNNTFTTKLESAVIKRLKKYNGEFALCSFNPNTIEYFTAQHPNLTFGIKVENFENKVEGSYKTKALKKLKYGKKVAPKFVMYYSNGLPNRYVKKFKNLPIIATDVNSQESYLKLIKYCDNITFYGFEPEI